MSWHYLQGQEEVSSEAICWDGERFAPSNGRSTLGGYCLPVNETESCLDSQSGTTFKPLTENHGEAAWMSSQEDSHVKTSAQPERAQESTAKGQECGDTWLASFAKLDRDSCLWKTPHCLPVEGLDGFSETWPRWGMMRDGECWELVTPVRRTSVNEFGFWPTPCLPGNGGTNGKAKLKRMLFTTPTAHNAKETNDPSESTRNTPTLAAQVGGHLNPTWVEWLMGWPIGWTDLKPLETDKFRQWSSSHGKHLAGESEHAE